MQYMGNFGRTDHETCELCDWMLGDKTIAELALTKPDPETDRDARINSEYAYHSRYEVCPRKDTIALWPRSDKGLPNCNFCTQKGIERTAYIDGKTTYGSWSYMCKKCFQEYGIGVGQGRGQLLLYNPDNDLDALTIEFIERLTVLNLVRSLGEKD